MWGEEADRKEDNREETVQEGVRAPGDCEHNPDGWVLAEGAEDTVTLAAHTGAWGENRQDILLSVEVGDPVSCSFSVLSLAMESTRNLTNVFSSFLGTSWKAHPTLDKHAF